MMQYGKLTDVSNTEHAAFQLCVGQASIYGSNEGDDEACLDQAWQPGATSISIGG
jgi:secreted trypsin-like serine protease